MSVFIPDLDANLKHQAIIKGEARLYVALYHSKNRHVQYEMAFLVTPKEEKPRSTGTRFLVDQVVSDKPPADLEWKLEESPIALKKDGHIIGRVMIAEVKVFWDLRGAIGLAPASQAVRAGEPPKSQEAWIREILTFLSRGNWGCEYVASWEEVDRVCRDLVLSMKYQRPVEGVKDDSIPTMDMICRGPGSKATWEEWKVVP